MAKERSLSNLESALVRAFRIDDYLELRRRFPGEDTALWIVLADDDSSPSFGMDFAYQLQKDFTQFDLPTELFLGVLDGDKDHIDLMCLKLLDAIAQRETLAKGRSHAVASKLAIGDALVDFLIGAMLESISYYHLEVPHSFQILMKQRLGLFQNAIKEERVLQHRRVMVALCPASALMRQTG